uniref:uncharacterized protein LOC124049819 isoform X2 n=1 Tax=Scatophagus argus TaxID=75038 RepID=UPI001ED83791|nr:uncharacterized protein LOC124049819 isoform X2 [Scatophagus argus]
MQAAAVSSEAMAEMDRTGLASTDGRSECTGGVTVSLDTRKKKGLKRHHKICEDRYIRASEELKKKEREKNLSLLHIFASNKHHSSSDSENTVVLGPTEDADEDTTVPELTRTDSIVLTRQMLGYTEIIEEGYVPETESDSSAEEDGRGRLYKKKRSEKVAINSNASDTEDEDDSTMKMSQHPSQHPCYGPNSRGGVDGSVAWANERNQFFNRFDTGTPIHASNDSSAVRLQQLATPATFHLDGLAHTSSPETWVDHSHLGTTCNPPPTTSTMTFTAEQVRRQLQRLCRL